MCVAETDTMVVPKSPEEIEIFDRYKKWLHEDVIPHHIVHNFKVEVEELKRKQLFKK